MPQLSFTAIDFETANQRRDSACQLASVRVVNGEIVASDNWFIRPRPLDFCERHIAIHGITPLEVANCPEFGEIWTEISSAIANETLVAHNALFDLGVLNACLTSAACTIPGWTFACTCQIARRTWPSEIGYGLKAVANRLGIRFKHHDALEDARACAEILIAACEKLECECLESLESKLGITRGLSSPYGIQAPSSLRRRSHPRRSRSHNTFASNVTTMRINKERLRELSVRLRDQRPLADQRIVFTGLLDSLDREGAERFASDLGAWVQQRVTRSTNILVVGRPDRRTLRAGYAKSTKERQADQLLSSGSAIRKLSEQEFLDSLENVVTLPRNRACMDT